MFHKTACDSLVIESLDARMKFKSAILTSASGSIGGMTASRNRGGMFFRGRVIPVNPNTPAQGSARAALANVIQHWSNTLTSAQRSGWATYAQGTPVVDRLGDQLILTGQQMYSKMQVPRLNAGLTLIDEAPTVTGLATTPEITTPGTLSIATGLASTVTVLDSSTDDRLIVYVSEPASPSRNPAHQRRRLAGAEGPPMGGQFTVAMTSASLPFAPILGNTVRVTYVFAGEDGRNSTEVFEDLVVTA